MNYDNKKFPVFKSHYRVKCAFCGRSLRHATTTSGTAEAGGNYRKYCITCQKFTWYDLEKGGKWTKNGT